MKKIKLLMPILGISAIAPAAISLASCGGQAKDETTYPFLFQALTNTTCSVKIKEGCKLENLTIPSEVSWFGDTFKVVAIAENGFINCKLLKNIIIPETVTTIGTYAFAGCTALETIEFKDTTKRWKVENGDELVATKTVNGKHAVVYNMTDKYSYCSWKATNEARVPITKITLTSEASQTLDGKNKSKKLGATVDGETGADTQIIWKSSDVSKVNVTEDGYIRSIDATEKGNDVTITLFAADDESKTATCKVKVTPVEATTETTLSLDFNQKQLSKDDTLMILHAEMGDVTTKATWTSETPTIATVDETTGKVTPLATGTAKFKATVVTEGDPLTSEVDIEIVKPSDVSLFEFEDRGTSYCIKQIKDKTEEKVKNLVFPTFYNGKPVTEFEWYLTSDWTYEKDGSTQTFSKEWERNRIESIVIPNSMTTIAGGAFEYCKNIKTLVLPNSTKKVEQYAFNGCRIGGTDSETITDLYIPANVEKIGQGGLAMGKHVDSEWGENVDKYHFVDGLWNITDWNGNPVAMNFNAKENPADASSHAHWENDAHNDWVKQ